MKNRYTNTFDTDCGAIGDTITAEVDGLTITARIEHDPDYTIDSDDVHNVEANPECAEDIERARKAYFNDEWFYVGVVLSVSKKGVVLDDHAASLWAIAMNYPVDESGKSDNSFISEAANEMLDEAVEKGKKVLAELCNESCTA